jgi:hypothetical protein
MCSKFRYPVFSFFRNISLNWVYQVLKIDLVDIYPVRDVITKGVYSRLIISGKVFAYLRNEDASRIICFNRIIYINIFAGHSIPQKVTFHRKKEQQKPERKKKQTKQTSIVKGF